MKTCLLILLVGAFTAGSTEAQVIPGLYSPLAQVKQFLQLTDSQLQAILANNEDYNRWLSDKQTRMRQVQTEIFEETRESPLDPGALGIRYAEVETICREMTEKAATSQRQNLAVLTADQKTKLTVLTDAIRLAPVISEAQYGNLISGSTALYGFTSASTGTGLIGGLISTTNGCLPPFPGDIIPVSRIFGTGPAVRPDSSPWFDTTKFVKP